MIHCPECNKNHVVKNGHISNGKQQWICKKCNRQFLNNIEGSKRYPPTKIPFPFIARMLYIHRSMVQTESGKMFMRLFRKHVNYQVWFLNLIDRSPEQNLKHWLKQNKGISRQTIYHWIKTYNHNLEKIISFDESKKYVENLYKNINNSNNAKHRNISIPEEPVELYKKRTHKQELILLQDILGGREKSMECLKNHPQFFYNILNTIQTPK